MGCPGEADGGNSDFALICGQIVARLAGLVGVGDDGGGQVDSRSFRWRIGRLPT